MLSAAIPNQIEERIGKTFLAVLSTAPAIAKPIPASPIAPSQPKKLSKIGGLLSSKTGNGAGNKNPMNANRESANQRKKCAGQAGQYDPNNGCAPVNNRRADREHSPEERTALSSFSRNGRRVHDGLQVTW